MKKIDAHAHLGYIGGWANIGMDADELISLDRKSTRLNSSH